MTTNAATGLNDFKNDAENCPSIFNLSKTSAAVLVTDVMLFVIVFTSSMARNFGPVFLVPTSNSILNLE